MALVLKDRVKGWTDSYGEDNFVIFATTNGYQSFSVIGNGNQTYYTVFDPTNYDWEVGIGTYTAATTTLSRDTILSSSNNNLIVSFLPGTKELFVGYPAEKAVTLDTPQTLTDKTLVNATVTSGAINNTTIGATTPASGAFTTLVASGASLTSVNAGVALLTSATVTTLNATGASIASANIGNLQFTAASIASINAGVAVITNLTATGASIASANVGTAVITAATVTGASIASANIGTAVITAATVTGASIASANAGTAVITALTVTGASVASANFGNVVTTTERVTNLSVTNASVASINAAVALITTGTVTNLTSTGASIASANVGVGVITALTATGASVASANVGTAVVTGLTVTNASIASLNAGTTTVTTGNLTFSSTAQRITGDFSNATLASRLSFQSSTTNGVTSVQLIPNGTATTSNIRLFNGTDTANSANATLQVSSAETTLTSGITGTGTYLPMTFYTNGSERMRLDTSGKLLVGLSSSGSTASKLQVTGGTTNATSLATAYSDATVAIVPKSTSGFSMAIASGTSDFPLIQVSANGAAAGDLLLQPYGGNVGIGTTSPGCKLDVYNSAAAAANNEILRLRYTTSTTAGHSGDLNFAGAAGTAIGRISSIVEDGTNVGLGFSTYNSSLSQKVLISANGNVGIGGTAAAYEKISVSGTYPTSSNVSQGFVSKATIPSGATSSFVGYYSVPSTQAAAFTCTSLYHFLAGFGTKGASSAITVQYGFLAGSDLTGATSNFGFYSDIASGSNRWNFYAAGTAANYFAGSTGVGIAPDTNYALTVYKSLLGLLVKNDTATNECTSQWNTATSGDNKFEVFYTDGGVARGSIDYNRAGGAVRYNTTSDYRAKDVYGAWDDSGATIDALKVYRGKMHGATLERPMMIAHEAQAVVPYAVSGEKDAVNKDGTPKYQTMDHQILVPLLIAELQAVRARLAALEAK